MSAFPAGLSREQFERSVASLLPFFMQPNATELNALYKGYTTDTPPAKANSGGLLGSIWNAIKNGVEGQRNANAEIQGTMGSQQQAGTGVGANQAGPGAAVGYVPPKSPASKTAVQGAGKTPTVGSPTTPGPDVAAAAAKGGGDFNAFINSPAGKAQIAAAGGAGTVSIWPSGIGVDPNAPVLGSAPQTGPFIQRDWTQQQPTTVSQTADAWLKSLYQMDPAQLQTLQQQLWAQGWYTNTGLTTPNAIQFGRVDTATLDAYGAALGETARQNAAGNSVALGDVINSGAPDAKLGTLANPASPYFAEHNPLDIASAFRSESQQLTGTIQPQQQAAEYAYMKNLETQASLGKDVAKTPGNAGQYEAKPTDQAAAEQFLINSDPQQIQAYGAASRAQQFFSMLGSPAGMHG